VPEFAATAEAAAVPAAWQALPEAEKDFAELTGNFARLDLVEKKPMLAPPKPPLGRLPLLAARSTRAPRLLAGSTSLPAEGVKKPMEALKLEVNAKLALVFPRFRIATKPVKIHHESA